jgi:hypothetical protein
MSRAASLSLLAAVLCLLALAQAKPIYDFRSSYVTQLTNLNFKDQVTKIRQNTNYVALVQFYKYAGKPPPIKMASPRPLPRSLMNGFMSTMESSGLALLIAMNTLSCAPTSQ